MKFSICANIFDRIFGQICQHQSKLFTWEFKQKLVFSIAPRRKERDPFPPCALLDRSKAKNLINKRHGSWSWLKEYHGQTIHIIKTSTCAYSPGFFIYLFNSSNDHRQVIKRSKEVIFLELFKAVHDFETWTEPQQLFSYLGWDTFGKKLKTSQRGSCMINGILLPKLFWSTVRKNILV